MKKKFRIPVIVDDLGGIRCEVSMTHWDYRQLSEEYRLETLEKRAKGTVDRHLSICSPEDGEPTTANIVWVTFFAELPEPSPINESEVDAVEDEGGE